MTTETDTGTINQVLIQQECSIPLFRGILKPSEKNLDPGPDVDTFLRLFNTKCITSGIKSFRNKKEKLIASVHQDIGNALSVVLNNFRLEEAKDWEEYEEALRSIFQQGNKTDVHGLTSELIHLERDEGEPLSSYEARIATHVKKISKAAIGRGWNNFQPQLDFLAEVMLLGEVNDKLSITGTQLTSPQSSLCELIELIEKKATKFNIDPEAGPTLHRNIRKRKEKSQAVAVVVKGFLEGRNLQVIDDILYILQEDRYLAVLPQSLMQVAMDKTHTKGHFGAKKTYEQFKIPRRDIVPDPKEESQILIWFVTRARELKPRKD